MAVLKASTVVLLVHCTLDEALHPFLLPLFLAVSQRIREGTTCGVNALGALRHFRQIPLAKLGESLFSRTTWASKESCA